MSSKNYKQFDFPNPKTTNPGERRVQRVLEMIPGILTWTTLIGMVVASWFVPLWAAVFIIAFDLYWITRIVYVTYYSLHAHRMLKHGTAGNWLQRTQFAQNPEKLKKVLEEQIAQNKARLKSGENLTKSQIKEIKWQVKADEKFIKHNVPQIDAQIVKDWESVIHVAALPTAGEDAEILIPSLEAIRDSNYPNDKIIILLATEEREEREHREEKVRILRKMFGDTFRDFIVTTHEVATGELKCKASNMTYAAKKLRKYLDERQIDYRDVVFSNLDCDSVVHREYFGALTYAYVTNSKRLQRAYQPIPVYHNNLWDTNAFVRVVVTNSSFWHMFQSTRREMVTFSSHAEPFDTLVRVGYWPVNMISEDSVIYWKCLAYFDDDYEVVPLPLPVSLDAVLANTYLKTIKNQYLQNRRWAYGIENFPVIMRAIWPNKKIRILRKLHIAFEMLEGHWSWATAPFLLMLLGWLPLIFGGVYFNQTVLAHNLPAMTRILMTLAMSGLVVAMLLSLFRLPPRPAHHSRKRYIYMIAQWILVPFLAPLTSIPAIDSHTRLLLGKYFGEFWVTEKVRRK